MNLVSLEFDLDIIKSSIDSSGLKNSIIENSYTITLNFDKINSISIKEDLQVCTADTIRGKNKTFNAYMQPKVITISGEFSDIKPLNVKIVNNLKESNLIEELDLQEVSELNNKSNLIGNNKSDWLTRLFNSMIDSTRLLSIKMFYKKYENYVISNFNLKYSYNNTIQVDLDLKEVLLNNLNTYEKELIPYSEIEKINEEQWVVLNNLINSLLSTTSTSSYIDIESSNYNPE